MFFWNSRFHAFAACCAIVSRDFSASSLGDSCFEADEQSLLQREAPRVRLATAGTSKKQSVSAKEVLADVRRLVDEVKVDSEGAINVSLAATEYAKTVEFEVMPSIQSAMAEIDDLFATQRESVKVCDVSLQVGSKSKEGLQHVFQRQRSEYKACAKANTTLAQQATECLQREAPAKNGCLQLEGLRAAKAAECDVLQMEVDAAACAQATHAHGMCETYEACRSSSMAAYDEAAHGLETKARDRRMQLLQARQAQCIARGLVASVGDLKSMLKQLEACDALMLDAKDQTVNLLPPAIVCHAAIIFSCSDGHLELDVGSANGTWSAPCGSCPAMTRAISLAAEVVPPEVVPPEKAPSPWRAWLSWVKELAWIAVNPRHRSAAALSLMGVDSKTSAHAAGQTTGVDQKAVVLLAIPVAALGVALFVTVVFAPSRNNISARPRSLSPTRVRTPPRTTSVSPPRTFDCVPSLPSRMASFASMESRQPSRGPIGLCPELTVPDGNECVLGIPYFAKADATEEALKTIANKDGQHLLSAGLTRSPAGGEYILLAGIHRQGLAFCETGPSVRAEGCDGKIFRWDGTVYAWLREANAEDHQRWGTSHVTEGRASGESSTWSSIPGPLQTYVVLSATGPPWELRLTGNLRERKFVVEDEKQQVVAAVSSGEELSSSRPASDLYRLRLGPGADSCTVIISLIAIERIGQHVWGDLS